MNKTVAIVAHGLGGGGAERVASILANNFAKNGYEVLFIAAFSPDRKYKLASEVKYYCADVKCSIKILRFIRRTQRIYKTLKNNKVDVVISFIINEMLMTSLFSEIPIIYSLRNDPERTINRRVYKWLCPFLYGRSKKIVFQTKNARAYFCKDIINNGIIIANPLINGLPLWNGPSYEKRIITAGRLESQKNHKLLIDAFSKFAISHPQYRLEIYGDGCLRNELENQIASLGIEDKVLLPGYSFEIHQIMADSDIFVMSSDYEGLSNSMLEALAIGIPTVCTDCPPGGAAEYITDGENGLLVPVGDVDALAEKLCLLADNPDLCRKLSQNSQRIREILDEKTILGKWNEVLQSAMNK